MSRRRPPRLVSLVALVLIAAIFVVAACSGAPDENSDAGDEPAPRPLTTATAYVPNSLRMNYHTDVIVFMDPTSGSQELESMEGLISTLPVKSALLITSQRAYDEAKC